MVYDNEYRTALSKELLEYSENGVSFSVDGMKVRPEDGLIDMLLAESDCTYMRNYQFKGGKIVKIEFDKVNL